MNVKKIGNVYERKFCDFLKREGWWAHIFEYTASGQPCDVVAIRNNIAILVDVKHCKSVRFPFSDIQPNQLTCFEYAKKCGNENVGFIIYFETINEWRYLPYDMAKHRIKTDEKSVKNDDLIEYTETFMKGLIKP